MVGRNADTGQDRSPSEIRGVLGDNLRKLLSPNKTISDVCAELGIHRSQFNRFLNGETFPKPDVLYKICAYFKTDSRILLEPIESFQNLAEGKPKEHSIHLHAQIRDYLQIQDTTQETTIIPCGFYRFIRGSFISTGMLQSGVLYVYEVDGLKFVRGFMAPKIAKELNIPLYRSVEREYRGAIIGTDTGVVQIAAHHGAPSFSFTYLDLKPYVEKSILVGYCARTMAATPQSAPVTPAIYERIPDDYGRICDAVRTSGFMDIDDLSSFYREVYASSCFGK